MEFLGFLIVGSVIVLAIIGAFVVVFGSPIAVEIWHEKMHEKMDEPSTSEPRSLRSEPSTGQQGECCGQWREDKGMPAGSHWMGCKEHFHCNLCRHVKGGMEQIERESRQKMAAMSSTSREGGA